MSSFCPLPVMAVGSTVCLCVCVCVFNFPVTSTRLYCDWGEEREMLSPGGKLLLLLLHTRLSYEVCSSILTPLLHSLEPWWAMVGAELHLWPLFLSFPCPAYLTQDNMTAFRCPKEWIFQVCLCVEQGILCWVIVLQCVVNLREETMESYHSTMMLGILVFKLLFVCVYKYYEV